MPELEKKQSFWTTMPGILTGIAALLTALTGLLVAVHPHGGDGSKDSPASSTGLVASSSAVPVSPAPVAASNMAPIPPAKVTKGFVSLTSRTGEVTQLSLPSFRHNFTDKSIGLTNGQTILFEKIRVIDFLDQSREQQESSVKVTLTDGRVVPGTLKTGYEFEGESDIGPFHIWLYDVKQVAFPPAN